MTREEILKPLVDSAFAGDITALKAIGDIFQRGDLGSKDIPLANYIYSLADGKQPKPLFQYMAENLPLPTDSINQKAFEEEQLHLEEVLAFIDEKIHRLRRSIDEGISAYFLEADIQTDRMRKQQDIGRLLQIRQRPYYARMDVKKEDSNTAYYIGEEYLDGEVVSVWSDFGRHYRAKDETSFTLAGVEYLVTRRRQINIEDGSLIDVFDEFLNEETSDKGSRFDPFLQKILAEKRGEENISNIIRSIQKNQNDIIDFDFDKSFIVQGCAGSGKTMILLHRLANLKYNCPDLKWNQVKIITPNSLFNTYIDALSENLGINMIVRCTMSEYYILLIARYRDLFNIFGGRRANEKIYAERHSSKGDENVDTWVSNYVYSKEFAYALSLQLDENRDDIKISPSRTENKIETLISKLLQAKRKVHLKNVGVEDSSTLSKIAEQPIQCILYAKVLSLYLLYGAVGPCDSLLCIDEGQGISILQYRLLQQVNGPDMRFNIYGDTNQKISQTSGIDAWETLCGFIQERVGKRNESPSVFELKENYRNSQEIVQYYNTKLATEDRAMGLKVGREVIHISVAEVETICKLCLLLKHRVVIICNSHDVLPSSLLKICIKNGIEKGKASLMSIAEVRGLEFDTAIVFENELSRNEKYIAYTRSLSELYVVTSETKSTITHSTWQWHKPRKIAPIRLRTTIIDEDRKQGAQNYNKEPLEKPTDKTSGQIKASSVHKPKAKTVICSKCRSIVSNYWGKCPQCGSDLIAMPIAPVSSSRQNEYDAFELDEENSFPEELEQKYFGLSDEYNPDDFESDEFEDATEDSWDGGY